MSSADSLQHIQEEWSRKKLETFAVVVLAIIYSEQSLVCNTRKSRAIVDITLMLTTGMVTVPRLATMRSVSGMPIRRTSWTAKYLIAPQFWIVDLASSPKGRRLPEKSFKTNSAFLFCRSMAARVIVPGTNRSVQGRVVSRRISIGRSHAETHAAIRTQPFQSFSGDRT